jgi:DNA-cytosine methyltransferase
VDTTKKFNHISLCAGYGGIDLGLSRVISNLRTIAICEIELYPIQNLVAKMEKGMLPPTPIWPDVKTFPYQDFYGKVDFFSGGFPCQPFSSSGKRKADDDPRHLFPYFKMGIQLCRPAFVFLENVRGIISSTINNDGWSDPKGTPVLLHVCRELERIGYQVKWGLYTASETGLPHSRHRVFILGARNDIKQDQFKEFSKYFSSTENSQESNLQRIGQDFAGVETIKSKYIATPRGRNRQQDRLEPRRTRLRTSNGSELGNTNQERSSEHRLRVCDEKVSEQQTINGSGTDSIRHETSISEPREIRCESTMGRNVNGSSDWLDYERLCNSFSNIQDEIALLGNGVVPATAEVAFRDLFKQLLDE